MAIEYSDPETRNLSITSMAFIVYYLAGGSFPSDEINFQVVNVHFSKPIVLAFIAWIMLFWFLYRYWLTHAGLFKQKYFSELKNYMSLPIVRRYFENKQKEQLAPIIGLPQNEDDDSELGYILDTIIRHEDTSYLRAVYTDMRRNNIGRITSRRSATEKASTGGKEPSITVAIEGLDGFLAQAAIAIRFACGKPYFSNYIVPYILFCLAILSAVYSWLSSTEWGTL